MTRLSTAVRMPSFRHAHLVVDGHVVPSAAGCEHFVHGIDVLDRLARFLGKHDNAEITCNRIVLRAAETAADKGLDDPDLAQRQLETAGQMAVVKIGALLRGQTVMYPDGS